MEMAIHIMNRETKETVGYLAGGGDIVPITYGRVLWFTDREQAKAMAAQMNKWAPAFEHMAMDRDICEWEGA